MDFIFFSFFFSLVGQKLTNIGKDLYNESEKPWILSPWPNDRSWTKSELDFGALLSHEFWVLDQMTEAGQRVSWTLELSYHISLSSTARWSPISKENSRALKQPGIPLHQPMKGGKFFVTRMLGLDTQYLLHLYL